MSATAADTGLDGNTVHGNDDAAAALLAAAFEWLYDTPQPEGALMQHLGIDIHRDPVRRVTVVPQGFGGLPVLVVNVTHPEMRVTRAGRELVNPLDRTEREWWTGYADVMGRRWDSKVSLWWNWVTVAGTPGITGSLQLSRAASPSLLAAVARYMAGCREHPWTSASSGASGVFCRCGWFDRGHDLVVRPRFEFS